MKSLKLFFAAVLCVNCFALFAQNPWQPENNQSWQEAMEENKFYIHVDEEHPRPDSVRIEFPELQSFVVFGLRNAPKELHFIKFFPEELKIILKEVAKGVSDPTLPHVVKVKIDEYGKHHISITEPRELKTTLVTRFGEVRELLPPGWEIDIEIKHQHPIVHVYGPDLARLEALANQSFQTTVDSITNHVKAKPLGRSNLVTSQIIKAGAIVHSDIYERHVNEVIELGLSTGFGYVANNFCPNLSIDMNLRFSDRTNAFSSKVGFNVERMFFAERRLDGSYRSIGNTFVNLFGAINLGDNKHTRWLGLGTGLMVNQKDGFFKGNTAKFYIQSTVGRFSVSPEYYLTNGYKDGLVGLKIGYTF